MKNINKPVVEKESFAEDIIAAGFLNYADSSELDSLKKELAGSFDIYGDASYKIAHIDAEELAEFSFDFFMPGLNRILAKRNLVLSARKLNNNDNSFEVLINSDTVELFQHADVIDKTFWDKAPRKFFQTVNLFLRTNHCKEQFYLLYGANDLQVLLLTERQFLIIADYYRADIKNAPYKP